MFIVLLIYFSNDLVSSLKASKGTVEYYMFLIIYIFSSTYLLFFSDLLTFYAAFELQNLCVYSIMAISSRKMSFFALRYFFLSSFISFIILFYVFSVLYYTHSMDISGIISIESKINNMLLVVFTFKFGIFPFTFWLIEFYKNFTNASLSFFVAITKVPIFFVFIKFSGYMDINIFFIIYLVISFILSFISMLTNLKNATVFFAFSSSNTLVFLLLYIFLGEGVDLYTIIYFVYYIISLCILFKFVDLCNIPKNYITLVLFFLLFGLPFSFLFFIKLYMLNSIFIHIGFVKYLTFLVIYILSYIPYFLFMFSHKTANNILTINNKYDLNILIFYIILSIFLVFFL